MASIGNQYLSLVDLAKRQNEDGTMADIIEILGKSNPIVQDAITTEGNLTTGHRSTIRTGIPTGTWRQLYKGVAPEKGTTKQVDDTIGMLEAYSEIDKKLAQLNGFSAVWRQSEEMAFVEGMSQNVASTMFYGNTSTEPEKFMGLAPRFSSLSAENGQQIIDAGGTGSINTSIWLVNWHESVMHLITPKGIPGGMQMQDLGEDTKVLANGSMYQVLRSHWEWNLGLVVKDWRHIVRIANVDTGDIDFSDASDSPGNASYSGPNIPVLLARAYNALFSSTSPGQRVIYCNRAVLTAIDLIVQGKSNIWFAPMEWHGQKITSYRGIPIRPTDAILSNEARVV